MGRPKEPIRFLDYLSSSGRNLIHEWIDGLPDAAKLKFGVRLQYLEDSENWSPPQARPLSGDGSGLYEIRFKYNNVVYRPLAFRGPEDHEATLLIGATERDDKFNPRNAVETAHARKAEVVADKERAIEHDYS